MKQAKRTLAVRGGGAYRTVSGMAGAGVLALLLALPAAAQERQNANQANWDLYERFSAQNINRFVHSTSVRPNWINETDSLWYAWEDRDGKRYNLVVPRGPAKRPLFDHQHMSDLLSQELNRYLEAHDLPLEDLEFSDDGRSIEFVVDDTRFSYHLDRRTLTNLGEKEEDERSRPWRNFSPDSTAYVYAEDHNLFFVEIVDGEEQEAVQLTTDGEEHYGFGARDADDDEIEDVGRRARRIRPNVNWSDDSRAFTVMRRDRRDTEELFLVNVLSEPRPTLESYRYAMPGEEDVDKWELHLFERDRMALRELDVNRFTDQRLFNMHWTQGGSAKLRMVRRARSQRALELIELDVATNVIRVLLTESVDRGHLRTQNIRYLGEDNTGDFVWYSRRTGWAHLYRYSHDGQLRNAITGGAWNVVGVDEVDADANAVWFTAVGREPDENVNYRHLYRVRLDGQQLTLLDPGDADHRSDLSPSGRFLLNNFSRVDLPPRSVLRDNQGRVVLELEALDVSELTAMGWQMPEPFVVRSADGVTDIYGNMWKPFDFDPERRYPVIAYVYPGPQQEAVRTQFGAYTTEQQLAQLGFIVVQVGNRGGTPLRSAAYHSYGYFNLRDYGLADKKAGIEQLAKMHPFLDATRVGIYGHSGGGFMTAAALLVPPYNEFFTVGVSSAGNHDNNVYNQNWSEQHHGLTVRCVTEERQDLIAQDEVVGSNDVGERASPVRRRAREVPNEMHCENGQDVEFEIHVPANHEVAENLRGRLLLQHGDMDSNVHHVGTMRLVRELMRHNKRFDFMMMPGMRHGFGREYTVYWARIRAEYFASHLLGDIYRSADIYTNH